ncbi:Bromo domain-containing protein [Heracleum sosnowskyi]|uniref:Bromo domain-containing protein n=1 Tax=Heracleum sosnowskyi TaxID=360622 RepID=A0AAD8MUT5_9APIA|nr:Bromo domain-containing protein [Heracleum sosnowskyi]
MKRKRGSKKGRPKKPSVMVPSKETPHVSNISTDDNSGADDFGKNDVDSGVEAGTGSSTGTDQPEKLATVKSGGADDKTTGTLVYTRVKVKIKPSKAFDSLHTSLEAPTQSGTDKSSHKSGLEKQTIAGERVEDSPKSLPESNPGLSVITSKKAGSIKIKSSRGFTSSNLTPCDKTGLLQGEISQWKEAASRQDSLYSKQELDTALEVIKKVMKMDAAEAFNAPVNPIALGIPDYFEVIDTPMDFGTICSNLENGVKYLNSKDVYKDVELIWNNCFKYNNKGDYVVDLMKRVKKNFTKNWTAAGLYSDPQQDTESIMKDVAASDHGKFSVKNGDLKHKTPKRHKVKKHKEDCMCAICIMMRRRQEREANAQPADDHIESSGGLSVQQKSRAEEASAVESPCGEDTSSSVENSHDQDGHADIEVKMENVEDIEELSSSSSGEEEKEDKDVIVQTKINGDGLGEERRTQFQTQMEVDGDVQNDSRNGETLMHCDVENAEVEHQEPKEMLDEAQKAKIYENLRRFENPMVLELCGTLFAEKRKSVWSGPHSITGHQGSSHLGSFIHAAFASFMKGEALLGTSTLCK